MGLQKALFQHFPRLHLLLLFAFKVTVEKGLVGLDLVELEEAGYLVEREENGSDENTSDSSVSESEQDDSSSESESSEVEDSNNEEEQLNDSEVIATPDSSAALLCCKLNKLNVTEQEDGHCTDQ